MQTLFSAKAYFHLTSNLLWSLHVRNSMEEKYMKI